MGQQHDGKSTIERAFEIAGSDQVQSMDQLVSKLGKEGYATSTLSGPLLLKQLRERLGYNKLLPEV